LHLSFGKALSRGMHFASASNVASLLGLLPDSKAPFSTLFSLEQQVSNPMPFALKWGLCHEMNGVASVLNSFQEVSAQLASKHQFCISESVCAHEQGLQLVHHDHPMLQQGTVFGQPSAQYAIAALPDAKLVGNGSELLLEVKCVCPFIEKDDGTGWFHLPFKTAFKGVSMKHYVQCQVQMLATSVSHCLLRWDVTGCKVFYAPFDGVWCRCMVCMLSIVLLAAAPLSGNSPDFTAIPSYKKFVGCTKERCSAVEELCDVDSEQGAVSARWL
jgi:hypothetical protein